MTKKTLLAFVDKSGALSDLNPIIDVAQSDRVHLTVLVLGVTPPSPVYAFGYPPYGTVVIPEEWQNEIKLDTSVIAAKVDEVEKALQSADISADVVSSYCEQGYLEYEVAELAKVSDFAVLPPIHSFAADTYSRVLAGVLFHSPIAAIVNAETLSSMLFPERVFIAWNTSLQAARAVHEALPLLTQAKEVVIGVFDPVMTADADGDDPGADVATWLSRCGCNVTLQQYPSGGREIADCIQQRATETGAGLVVMGAYSHSRMRQRIFGGTTQAMLDQNDLAVLLAH